MQDIFEFFSKFLSTKVRYGGNASKVITTGDTEEHRVERGLFFPAISVDHALDPVPQVGDMEINQQTDSDAAQPHVRQKLRLMDWMNRFNALHFDDHELFDDQVDPVAQLDSFSVENHRQTNLAGNCKPAFSKFMSKTSLIRAPADPGRARRERAWRKTRQLPKPG
jgi:hypothetical protein